MNVSQLMLAFSSAVPLGALRCNCRPAASPARPRIQAVANRNDIRPIPSSRVAETLDKSSTLTESLQADLSLGHLWDAIERVEAALSLETNSSTPLTSYRHLHELIYQAAQKRNWQIALRGFYALEHSGLYTVRSTSTHLFNALCRAGRIGEACEVLDALWKPYIINRDGSRRRLGEKQQARREPDEKMVTQIANSAIRTGRSDVAVKIVREMEAQGVRASIFTISVLINALGRQENPDAVKRVLAGLEGSGLKPDAIVINTAIEAFIRCGERKIALQLLRRMSQYGLTPTVRSFNPIFRDLARNSKIEEMEALRKEMERLQIAPTSRTYNAFIHVHVKSRNWKRAAELLNESATLAEETQESEMLPEEDSTSKPRRQGKSPVFMSQGTAVGYTTVISGLAVAKDIKHAMALLERMVKVVERMGKTHELELEIGIAVTAILSAMLAQDDVIRAWTLFRTVRRRFQVRLPPDMYNAVIRGLAKRGDKLSMEAATMVFNEMMTTFRKQRQALRDIGVRSADGPIDGAREATTADISMAYNSLIDGYVRCGNSTMGEQLLDELEDSGHVATVVTYTTLMGGYGRELDIASTRRVFRRMQKAGIAADRVTMNVFIGACVRTGDMELAVRLFEQMQRLGGRISPDLVTFSAIIAGYVRQNRISEAWDAYEEMKGVGIVPNERLLERMMAAVVAPELKPGRDEVWEILDNGEIEEGEDEVVEGGERDDGSEEADVEDVAVEQDESLEANLVARLGLQDGWSSKRVLVLLEDMENCKCSDINKRRWRKAIENVWTF